MSISSASILVMNATASLHTPRCPYLKRRAIVRRGFHARDGCQTRRFGGSASGGMHRHGGQERLQAWQPLDAATEIRRRHGGRRVRTGHTKRSLGECCRTRDSCALFSLAVMQMPLQLSTCDRVTPLHTNPDPDSQHPTQLSPLSVPHRGNPTSPNPTHPPFSRVAPTSLAASVNTAAYLSACTPSSPVNLRILWQDEPLYRFACPRYVCTR